MSHEDVSNMFQAESDNLDRQISDAADSALAVSEIVALYYQVINVSSMATMLKQQIVPDRHAPLLEQIMRAESMISEKFNSQTHPKIRTRLAGLIAELTKNLQSENATDAPEAYEELRQMMSTLEFVEQYEKGLSG